MPPDSLDNSVAWRNALTIARPALVLAPRDFLGDVCGRLDNAGVIAAVARCDATAVYDWIVGLLARQGISNHAAEVFAERHGSPAWRELSQRMALDARCPRLKSRWQFEDCSFRRSTATCSTPHHLLACPVTEIPARKGSLAEAAVGLWLFLRDICDCDLVGWIDDRVAGADLGTDHPQRAEAMRDAVLEPMLAIPGTGTKVWSMILADLLLGADPHRERWVAAGASFIAVDSLVHAYLARTGILSRLGADHAYGPACATAAGCTGVIAGLAARIDAREFNPGYPARFDRWVQYAIWQFCAEGGLDLCNGRHIDDSRGCRQRYCPAFTPCKKMVIKPVL